ncbi:TIGR03016 family PEP-CTERM system-associated outer membrane protein [Glaciimonas sp. Gout2]|nr:MULTISPECIES: TIGR03016 family PEP-CTERM system-associated outer membrane protein [unclassified Glaciimonas]MDY7544690.1 TIGR03016 family PEP-CTERM system-associated outer membrane protein [Glaciimonas sp. CA11.2]MEB0012012.1 TIGR03016 family PEP-CTERM system-associated outer membrane protein [Glaciimonas sp. Cout2]MEB0084072.1 TIGR03016 family PEP-CTERM system-associated outer membrane protein [Glaciimonas sp. Gout2]
MSTAVALVLSSVTFAAEWSIIPSLGVNETYTDNVNLAPKSFAKSDYITEISPSIVLVKTGRYLRVNVEDIVQEVIYSDKSTGSKFTNQLHATVKAELIDELFFVDSAASESQQNISAFGAQPTNNIYATNNRTNVRTFNFSPYLAHTFDTFAAAELRYAVDSVAASSGALASSHSDTTSFHVNSGPAFRLLGWGWQYSDRITHYPTLSSVKLASTSGNLSYLLLPVLKLTATVGYDRDDYPSIGKLTNGFSWTTGFALAVNQRTSLVATVGRRYYGDTFSLAATTRSRTAIWDISYNDTVTTTQSQFGLPAAIDTSAYLNRLLSGTLADPVQRQQAVNNIIQNAGLPGSLNNSTNYFTNAVFLQKQLQASVAIISPKTTLVVSLFDVQREPLSTAQNNGISLSNDKTNQVGGSVVLGRRLTSQINANISLLASRVESLTSGRVDHTQTLRLDIVKQFSAKLKGTVELSRSQGESNQAGIGYRANTIAGFFNVQL